jgi:5'-3' exonuclease
MNVIFDGNYLFHKNFSVFSTYYKNEDISEVLQDKEKQQVLIRKCVIDFCYTVRMFKNVDKVIFTIDSSSWRYNLYANYKYSLTKVRDDSYRHFLICLDLFHKLLNEKGVIVSRVNGAEGDDLMYVWSLVLGYVGDEDNVIVTGDSDIRQLVNDRVSVMNSNSKQLSLYCVSEREEWLRGQLNEFMNINTIEPFDIVLYKVIMGDKSDNIPKLFNGFGEKAFEKFMNFLKPYKEPQNVDLVTMGRWIADAVCRFMKKREDEVLGQILFNLKMTWLNLSVYESNDLQTYNGKELLQNMIDDINSKKYKYKGEYTLESFYGMLIK